MTGTTAAGVTRDEIMAAHAELGEALEDFARRADADLAALLQQELFTTVDAYEALKTRAGSVDFLDLLLRTRNLVRDRADVRAELQRRFTHIFVDEFQDTDPLQAEILLLLASADPAVAHWREVTPVPGKLFVVGDPKQSIYRFRRADVGIYQEVKALLASRGAAVIELRSSFRAVPDVQRLVNAAFSPRMVEDAATLQSGYVPLAAYRDERPGQPSVVALPVPKPYGRWGLTKTAIDESLPDAVGAFVRWLVEESGWRVTERERPGEDLPVAARHVCLLFRRFTQWGADVTQPYVEALEARNIPHMLVGGKSFHQREEVESLRTALTAIEWPDDELAVYGALRGPLFAVATRRCSSTASASPACTRFACPRAEAGSRVGRASRRIWRRWPRASGCSASCIAGATCAPSRRPSPRSSRRRARTRRSSCGPPASGRSPTCSASPSWRAAGKRPAASRSAASSSSSTTTTTATPPRRPSSRKAARASAS